MSGYFLLIFTGMLILIYALLSMPPLMMSSLDSSESIGQMTATPFSQEAGRWIVSGWPRGSEGETAYCSVMGRDDKDNAFSYVTTLMTDGRSEANALLLAWPENVKPIAPGEALLWLDDGPPEKLRYDANGINTAAVMLASGNEMFSRTSRASKIRLEMETTTVLEASLLGFKEALPARLTCVAQIIGIPISSVSAAR